MNEINGIVKVVKIVKIAEIVKNIYLIPVQTPEPLFGNEMRVRLLNVRGLLPSLNSLNSRHRESLTEFIFYLFFKRVDKSS
jgi:hypothetical protein